jgi:DNA repair protein RadD
MMRVKYFSGVQRFTELVCLEHDGFAAKRARDWWRVRRPDKMPPSSTYEGLRILTAEHVPIPTHILVEVNTKYPRVISHSFDGTTPLFVPDPIHPGHMAYKPKTLIVE